MPSSPDHLPVLLLAAGLGTRLRPLTDTMPKALVPLAGTPLLEHQLRRLETAGFTRVVINVHHFADQITSWLDTHPHPRLDIRISDERACLLDTGGAIRQAARLLPPSDPFLVHNVDILHNLPLRQFYDDYAHQADAVLLVSPRPSSRRLVLSPDDSRLMGWANLQTGEIKSPFTDICSITLRSGESESNAQSLSRHFSLQAFSGIHICSQRLVARMHAWPERFSIIDFYLSVCRTTPLRCVVRPDLRLLDVGKPDALARADRLIAAEQGGLLLERPSLSDER